MAEYIEREALLKRFDFSEEKSFTDAEKELIENLIADAIINEITAVPAADVVEVVRCKDCEYWQDNNGGYPHEECRWGKGETPDADDFCSYGERKENG